MRTRHSIPVAVAALLSITLWAGLGHANPLGGTVVAGSGRIESAATETRVSQGSERLVIDWQSFNLAVDERVVFDQPGASASVLNRIGDRRPSLIQGRIDANGQVFLMNPNGVIFGRHARVDVGALVAGGLRADPDAFMAGRLLLDAADGGAGAVINRGRISAPGGVALVGGGVVNEGFIQADMVYMGAGRHVVDFDGDRLFGFAVTGAGAGADVLNGGGIRSERVVMSADGAAGVLSGVVNNSGMIAATGVVRDGGTVRLVGDTVIQSGHIDVHSDQGRGGDIALLGERVSLAGGSVSNASGATGGGSILVGGHLRGSGPITSNTTRVAAGAELRADALGQFGPGYGDGGTVVVWGNRDTVFQGRISARGGASGGDGGMVEVSGADRLTFAGGVDTSAAAGNAGTLLLDPSTLTLIDAIATVGDQDPAVADALLLSGDPNTLANTLSWGAIDALAATSNVVLEATGQITVADVTGAAGGTVTAADLVSLDLVNGGSLTLRSSNAGVVFADVNDTLRTEGGSVTIQGLGGSVAVGRIDTTGAAGTRTGGTVAISAAGDLSVTAITTLGGNVALNADRANNIAGATLSTGTVNSGGGAIIYQGGTDLDDTLQAPTGANDWTVTGLGSGTLNGAGFSNFGHLGGGAGNDRFVFGPLGVVPGTIFGGTGSDSADYLLVGTPVNVNLGTDLNGVESVLAGSPGDRLTGADLSNAWQITGLGAGNVGGVTFNGFSALSGGAGSDTFTLAGGTLTGGIDGGGGADTLVAQNIANDWQVTGPGSGTLNGSLGFSAMESLTGGSQADGFTLSGGSLTGSVGGGAGLDTLTVDNFTNTWTINGPDQGTVTGVGAFNGIENLVGGAGDDTFTFAANGAISGVVDGGAQSVADRVDLSAVVAPQAIRVGSGYGNIESFIGDGVNDSLFVGDGQQTWTQSALGSGTVGAISFSAMATLVGGAGVDTLVGSNAANTWNVTGVGAGRIDDGTASVAFSGMESLSGGAGADVFALAGGRISGLISGGVGNDTLVADSLSNSWAVTGADSGSVTGTGGFAGVENLVGGSGDDQFTIAPGGTVGGEILGGAGNDTLTIDYSGGASPIFHFNGGTGSDTLLLSGSADSGTIDPGTDGTLVSIGYQAGAETLTLQGRGVERIDDTVVAGQLTVFGTDAGEIATLGPATLGGNNPAQIAIGSLPLVAYSNKDNVHIDLKGGTDTLHLSGPVSVPVGMQFSTETITAAPGSTLTTGSLLLSGPAGVGTDAQPLRLNVTDLTILQASHHVFVENQGGLTLRASDLAANLTLRLGGGLISHDNLTVGGNLSVRVAVGADIILDGAGNRFDGGLDLAATDPFTGNRSDALGTVSLVDSTDMVLPRMTLSGNLVLRGQGVSQSGSLAVAGTSTLDGGAGGIALALPGNRFTGPVTLTTSAGNVAVASDLALLLGASNLGAGSVTLGGNGISQSGALVQADAAGSISLNGAAGAVLFTHTGNRITGTLSVDARSADVFAGAPLSVGTIRTNGDVTLTANGGMLFGLVAAGAGRITLVATGNLVTAQTGGIQLSGAALNVDAPGLSFGSFSRPLALDIGGPVHFGVAEAFYSGSGGTITSAPGTLLSNVNAVVANTGVGHQVVPWPTVGLDPSQLASPPRLFALSAGGLRLPPEERE